jgi:hypothetical protein
MAEFEDYPWRYFTPAALTLFALVLAVTTVINGRSLMIIILIIAIKICRQLLLWVMRLSQCFAMISTPHLHIGGRYSSSNDSAGSEIIPIAENRSPFLFELKDTCDAYQFVYSVRHLK